MSDQPHFTEPRPHTVYEHAAPSALGGSDELCPYCRMQTKPGAIKCGHCGSALSMESRDMRVAIAVISALLCVGAGLYLMNTYPLKEGDGNILFTIAHGMGVYFIGKGLYCGAALWPASRGPQPVRVIKYAPSPPVPQPRNPPGPLTLTGKIKRGALFALGALLVIVMIGYVLAIAYPARFTNPMEFWREHLASTPGS